MTHMFTVPTRESSAIPQSFYQRDHSACKLTFAKMSC